MKRWLVVPILLVASICHAVTIRGSASATFSASSVAISWPSGTVAGDYAIIAYFQGCGGTIPSGWAMQVPGNQTLGNYGTGSFYGMLITRILTAGDISTGSVTITAGCGFDGITQIVTLVGASSGFREINYTNGASPVTLTSSVNIISGDLALYFAQDRGNGSSTVSRGTLLHTATTGSACGSVYSEALTGGSVAPVFTTPNTNNVSLTVIISTGSSAAVGLAQ